MSDTNERSVASGGCPADIIDRLLAAVTADAPMPSMLLVSAATEIERLRFAVRRIAEQNATLSVCGGNVTVTMDATLTDAEREAVDLAIDLLNGVEDVSAGASSRADAAAATLRGLLERLGGRE